MVIGLVSGYVRWADGIIMRIMDGLMAIPGILLAIALVSIWRAGLITVIFAIVVPDVPRVVRLVRSIVLTVREEPYVEGAISVGTPTWILMFRHILPNTVAPLIVQGTFLAAAAILAEAALSFLGIGIPPEIPSWGNIMAEGRTLFRVFPHNILYPGIFLAFTVLAINIMGDGLRDTLDPKMSKKRDPSPRASAATGPRSRAPSSRSVDDGDGSPSSKSAISPSRCRPAPTAPMPSRR